MSEPKRALPRALLLMLVLSLAPVAASAATVRYWVPDNPWVQAMLAMMETLGMLEPAPPGYGETYNPGRWPGNGFGGSGFPGLSNGFDWPGGGFDGRGFPGMSNGLGWPAGPGAGMPFGGANNFWSPQEFAQPGHWYGRRANDGLAGLWLSPDGETLWLDNGGFAYRDASGRSLGGRMLRQGNRLLVELEGGHLIAMQYELRGPYLQILDPQGLVRQFRRVR